MCAVIWTRESCIDYMVADTPMPMLEQVMG